MAADLYGDFQDDNELEEDNEDDIGALGSILSWDEEDEDDGQAVNRSAAALSVALKERESAAGTSAPPDMVQFSMKDGVPQFSFLSSFGGTTTAPKTSEQRALEGNSSITLQLPMPTPISNFDSSVAGSEVLQSGEESQTLSSALALPASVPAVASVPATAAVPVATIPTTNAPAAALPQPSAVNQTQQNLAATFARLLAQQAGSLFTTAQPEAQSAQQPAEVMKQHTVVAAPQPAVAQVAPAAQPVVPVLQGAAVTAQTAAPQQPQHTPQPPKQPQQVVQTQPSMATIPNAQTQPTDTVVVPQISQQIPLPFPADPTAFIQQLQFAQFHQQLQLHAQQQQQVQSQNQQPPRPILPQTPAAVSLQQTDSLQQNVLADLPTSSVREGPPPAKRAKTKAAAKTTPTPRKAAKGDSKKQPPPVATAPASASAAAQSSTTTKVSTIVSASDTDGEARDLVDKLLDDKQDTASVTNLSADDKARANRDRNREHARNTRLRKKAYLEKLKATVEELCRERDTLVSERAGAANLLVEMHNTRTEVLMSFFALRSSNDKRRNLWASILDESSFTCVMPVTPYRSFPASEVQVSKCQRTIQGIDAIMSDTASLHVLFNSLVDRTRHPQALIEFRYTLVTEESVVAGNQIMARWVMATVNATKFGASMEVAKQGMLCCKFNAAHRITGLELMFDVMAFMLQLKQAAGSDSFSVIPNTVQTCQRTFDKPMVMMLSEPPYTLVQVNDLWEQMTGFRAEEVVGKATCAILHNAKSGKSSVEKMMEEIRLKRPAASTLHTVKKSGEDFRHHLLMFPLSTDSRITHYLALSSHVLQGAEPKVQTKKRKASSDSRPVQPIAVTAHRPQLPMFPQQQVPFLIANAAQMGIQNQPSGFAIPTAAVMAPPITFPTPPAPSQSSLPQHLPKSNSEPN